MFELPRERVEAAFRGLLELPDAALERPWRWRSSEQDVRYGLYRLHEVIGESRSELDLDAMPAAWSSMAAQATAARWDLHGLLLGVTDIEQAPAAGEWSVRETLSHLAAAQRNWEWLAGWWLARARAGEPIPLESPRPEERPAWLGPRDADGTPNEIRRRIDRYADGSIAHLAELDRRGLLDTPVMWSRTAEVTIRFYPYRWAAHLREHTQQIDKTLLALGPRSELERVVRILAAAYGELEGAALGVAESVATEVLGTTAESLARHADEVRQAALASA